MQAKSTQAATQLHPMSIVEGQEFDFSSLANGTPLRVSPSLIDDLSVGGNHRRKTTRSAEFKESVRTKGVIQSLTVRPSTSNPNRLELCAGYGRRDTALEFDLADVPVVVYHYSDKEALAAMLTENKDREDISIVDEADLAQSYLSLHEGDYATAAVHLGLSEKVFRERLQLKRCSEKVLEALADKENPVSLGHALILSTFDEVMQENTLASIIADPKTYTVKELKLRASKRQLPLSSAPFNTADCANCKYNTGEQLSFMGMNEGEEESKCSRLSCFSEKAQQWLRNERVAELEEKYGRVILWEVKPESDRRIVTPASVGEKQFNEGCMSCESKCVVVDDRPMRWGQYTTDQCIDTDCFSKCAKAHKDAEKAKRDAQKKAEEAKNKAVEKPNPAASEQQTEKTPSVTATQQEEAPIQRKTSQAVMEDYRKLLRKTSAETVVQDPQFRMAVALTSLCAMSDYSPLIDGKKQPHSHWQFNERVREYMKLDLKTIQEYMLQAVIHHATNGGKEGTNPTDLMIAVLGDREDGIAVAVKAWMPTKDRLAMYNIAQIQQMCKESGFAQAYEAEKGEGEFSLLFKNRKDDIVNGVMGFAFDWTHYAPSDYLSLVQ